MRLKKNIISVNFLSIWLYINYGYDGLRYHIQALIKHEFMNKFILPQKFSNLNV